MSIFTRISILSFTVASFLLPSVSFAQLSDDPTGSSGCVELTKTMSYGARDATTDGEVSELQAFLKEKGYLKGITTGSFGSMTRTAVKSLQAEILPEVDIADISETMVPSLDNRTILANSGFKLSNTGTVGGYTRAKIAYISCQEKEGGEEEEEEEGIYSPLPSITSMSVNKSMYTITVNGTDLSDVLSLVYTADSRTGGQTGSKLMSTTVKTPTRIVFKYGDTTAGLLNTTVNTWNVHLLTADEKKSADFTWERGGVSNQTTKTLTVTKVGSPNGIIVSSPSGINCGSVCSTNSTTGSTITLTAQSNVRGYIFKEWGGACSGTNTTCTVTMSEAKSVNAMFVAVDVGETRTLTVTKVGQGTVTSNPGAINCGTICSSNMMQANQTVTLTARPESNTTFTGWSGACTGTTPTCTVTMSEAKSVNATFTTTNVQATGRWTFSASCPTACGQPATTQTAVCTGGNGVCPDSATTRSCSATSVCATPVTCASPLVLNTSGTACVSQPNSSSGSTKRPFGHLDSVTSGIVGSCGLMEGWALDKDNISSPTEINVYVDGDAGTGVPYNIGLTTENRPDVNSAHSATGRHGYKYQIPNLTAGTHTVYVYSHGVNTEGGMISTEPRKLEGGSRYTFLCNSQNDTSSATNPGSLVITTNNLHPIVSGSSWEYNLTVTGATEPVTWSLVSGVLPVPMELDPVKGTISNYRLYNTYPSEINNKIAVGVHTFTVKATSGQYSVSKQLSFEVLPQGTQKPIINDQIQPNMAVDQYAKPGSIPDNSWYLYTAAPPDTCTLVSGQLPPGITLRKSDYGYGACVLSGIARQTGVFKVVWRAQNQFGSDEREFTVTVYRPSETYNLNAPSDNLPDGVVGRPYYHKFSVTVTGNPDLSYARFLPRDSALHNVGLTLNEITGEITGTPTKAWSGMVAFNYGISTFLHLSGQKSVQLTIKDSGSAQVSPSVHSQVLGVNTMSLSCLSLQRNLIRGAESEEVSSLQNFLIQKGFLESPSTGFYGDNTVEAVKDYQASKGLPATGMVYDFTRKAIEEETCR